MQVTDLVPICVLPTEDHDVLYVHKDDVDKEMSVCLFMDYNSKAKKSILSMHQTQMYLSRSLIDYEIENVEENIKFYLDRLTRKYSDQYIEEMLSRFEEFREEYNKDIDCSSDTLFEMIDKYNLENDTN